ncbi:MAG TPA: ABC transporter permease, partial [Candidatus Goldiibacteriota bacterium]|nr:ABC transporter permease [Candidatus Goldiibacteriota bacterium]
MNKMMITGAVITGFMAIVALASPFLAPYDYKEQNMKERLLPPSSSHIMGTDEVGRDVFSRMLAGARVSMSVGIIAVIIAALVGVALGAVSGYFGGMTDAFIMRLVDI